MYIFIIIIFLRTQKEDLVKGYKEKKGKRVILLWLIEDSSVEFSKPNLIIGQLLWAKVTEHRTL